MIQKTVHSAQFTVHSKSLNKKMVRWKNIKTDQGMWPFRFTIHVSHFTKLLAIMLCAATIFACSPRVTDMDEYTTKAKAGDRSAISTLITFLDHPEEEIKSKAYQGLIQIPADSKPYLAEKVITLLKSTDSEGTKEFSVAVLGKLRIQEAVLVLVQLSKDTNFKRRYVVYTSLGEIQDVGSVNAVIDGLLDPLDDVRKFAARALIRIGPRAIPVMMERFPKANDETKGFLIRAFGEMRNNTPEELVLSELSGANKLDAIWALGKIGKKRSLPFLLRELTSSDYMVRIKACQALGDLNLTEAIPALKKALNDKDVLVREWAARSLEVLTGERTYYRDEAGKRALPYNLYH